MLRTSPPTWAKAPRTRLGKRFRVLSLNDNVSWMTALANDYAYEEIFVGQLQNYAQGRRPRLRHQRQRQLAQLRQSAGLGEKNGLRTVALVGAKRGRMAEIAEQAIVINDTHYGRVEDAQMGICHMICYAFMEHPEWAA